VCTSVPQGPSSVSCHLFFGKSSFDGGIFEGQSQNLFSCLLKAFFLFAPRLMSPPSKPLRFDYVIVGAGPSALGIVYGLLEKYSDEHQNNHQPPSFSIAIVERGQGPPQDDSLINQPHRWYEAAHHAHKDSNDSVDIYSSQITARKMEVPVGKGLGGTSNVNACLCLPPLPRDLEQWPEPWKSNILTTTTRIQKELRGNNALHECPSLVDDTTPNFLWYKNVATLVTTIDKSNGTFLRSNYYSGLLEPLLSKHPHLQNGIHWFRGVQAERLLLNGKKIVGVECQQVDNNKNVIVCIHAMRRTILCAGAIESPVLLLVSGLGNKIKGIGKNLKDQALLAKADLTIPLSSKWKTTNLQQPNHQSTSGIAELGHFTLPASKMNGIENIFQVMRVDSKCYESILPAAAGTVFRWKCSNHVLSQLNEVLSSAIKFCAWFMLRYTLIGWIVRHFVTVSMIFLMQPQSSGEVTIQEKKNDKISWASVSHDNKSPLHRSDITVHVNPGYLHMDCDRTIFQRAWEQASTNLTIPGSLPSSTISVEIFPKPLKLLCQLFTANGDGWFWIFCQFFLHPYFHFAGTCAMRSKESMSDEDDPHQQNWVVESSTLKLREHEGLYICDASVFPSMISNPPALTCAALGYHFSSMILEEDEESIRQQEG
jgi:choline dehydrogenase-like flavoprotein